MFAIWFKSRVDIDYTLDYNFIAIKFMVLKGICEKSALAEQHAKLVVFLQKIYSVNKIFGLIFELFFYFQEYGEFLNQRKAIVEEQKKMLQEKREAKMLRTA